MVQVDHSKMTQRLGPNYQRLVQEAALANQADDELTLRQALVKYKKAVFWSMFVSCALVMEGYDLVVVSRVPTTCPFRCGSGARQNAHDARLFVDQFVLRATGLCRQVRNDSS